MSIRIITDSASDLEKDEIIQRDIDIVRMTIDFDGTAYIDGQNLTKTEFFKMLKSSKTFPKTSQPSPADFVEKFSEIKDNGDQAIVICLSGGLSGTLQSAILARDMVQYDDIYIIDSLSATIAMRILIDEAIRLVKCNTPAKEIAQALEALKGRIKILAALDTLEYLYKGGRLSIAQASIGTLTKLKPIITVNKEGKVAVINKALGKKKAMAYIANAFKDVLVDDNYPIYPAFSYDETNCNSLIESIKAQRNDISFQSPVEIGPTIGAHVGPNAYGIVYVQKATD